ncbi:MAG: cytochrome d ubiquinol oxidase subunit II [Hyphomicrobiaceae bacterium]|nr:cytochrome d ubiquinol oxidase subunit II [Hyphomicrobiaceae bacterium]
MTLDLPLIWAFIIAFAILAYVVLDGFDLGVGILFPFLDGTRHRDTAMNSVAPVWDGNETWLVLGGGGLFAVFPLAYAIILPALYPLVIAMLLGLILRGVAFEFRWKTERAKFLWDWAFAVGSFVAALAQGIMLGALIQGIKVDGRAYAGGWFDWFSPFSLLTGLSVVIGYTLLGATWLIWKTEDYVQNRAYGFASRLTLALLVCIAAVSLWTPFLNPQFLARWFSWPAILYVAPVPLLTLFIAAKLVFAVHERREQTPFLATLGLFVVCYVGLGISLYPAIVPPSITIWDAAAPDTSLRFLLIGSAVLLPIIVAYSAYSYWVFRGKVDTEGGYH